MSAAIGERQQELTDLETIQFVTSALFDVSAERIGRLRAAFEKNQTFYQDISDLYGAVKLTAQERGDLPEKSPGITRRVLIAFTSNLRFYGSINADVMAAFLRKLNDPALDFIVIGKTGQSFMENYALEGRRIQYLSFEGDDPTVGEVRQFLKQVEAYEEVNVLFPAFVNVFTHKVSLLDITHTPHPVPGSKAAEIDYIFEPELAKILQFFETRVRYLLFQRAVLESELARTAARLFSMNRAQDRARDEITHVRRAIQQDIDTFNDLRLLESFSAISRWKK